MTRVLVLSHVFPRPLASSFGVFVRQRVAQVARHLPVEVVAPLPWFPGGHWIGRTRRGDLPHAAMVEGLRVHYPTVPSIPGVGRALDPLLFASALLPFLQRLRRRFAFDLIDAHFGYPDGVAAALLGRWLGCPVSITLRGCEQDIALRPARRRQLAWALRQGHVVGVSPGLSQLARDLGATKVHTIANGVDVARFTPGDRHAARRRLGLPQDRTVLLAVGAFVPVKRHDRLLQVVARLRAAGHPRLLFVAVGGRGGTQSCFAALRRQVAEFGLDENVRFVVDRPHAEMPEWFRAADLACVASEREGSPNGVLEALACGLPVVAVAVGDIPSRVRTGVDGCVLPRFDTAKFATAIDQALHAEWDRAAIAAQAARRSWDDVALEVVEVMHAATRDPGGCEVL